MTTAEAVRRVREARGYRREDVAAMTGLSYSTIEKIETGKQDPRGETLKILAEALEVPADVLLGRSDFEATRSYLKASA